MQSHFMHCPHEQDPSKGSSMMLANKIDKGYEEQKILKSAIPQEQLLQVQSKPIYDYCDTDSSCSTIPHHNYEDGKEAAQETEKRSK
jgi:hypothetical protein